MNDMTTTEGPWTITITEDIGDWDDPVRKWDYTAVNKLTGETRYPSLTPYASDPETLARLWVQAGCPGRMKSGQCSCNWDQHDLGKLIRERWEKIAAELGLIG